MQLPINRGTDKQITEYPNKRVQLRNRKEGTIDMHNGWLKTSMMKKGRGKGILQRDMRKFLQVMDIDFGDFSDLYIYVYTYIYSIL